MFVKQKYLSETTKPAQSELVLKIILQIDNQNLQKLYLYQNEEFYKSKIIYYFKIKNYFSCLSSLIVRQKYLFPALPASF